MRNITWQAVVAGVLCAVMLTGCGNKGKRDKEVLARINDYKLYVPDFEDEIRLILGNRPHEGDQARVKKELLDDIITKKIMLQEAQKLGLDRKPGFMKEIERYWEQALLKLLIREKTYELIGDKAVKDKERALKEWIDDLKRDASVRVDERLLDKINIK